MVSEGFIKATELQLGKGTHDNVATGADKRFMESGGEKDHMTT